MARTLRTLCTRCGHPYAKHGRTRWKGNPWEWVHLRRLTSDADCTLCDCRKFTLAKAPTETTTSDRRAES